MAFRFRAILLPLTTVLVVQQHITFAELVVKPTDTEALVGDPTYFNCSTSDVSQEVQWFHYPLVVNGERKFVYGNYQFYGEYKDRFTIEKNEATGTFNLVIKSVQVEDAGRFECQDDVGRGVKAFARLIVLSATSSSTTKPYVDAILIICLLLIPLIIAGSIAGGIFIQSRWGLKIFSRQAIRRTEEDVSIHSDDEQLKLRTLDLTKAREEQERRIDELEKTTIRLEEEKRELESRLYPSAPTRYSDKPKLVNVIEIKELKSDSKKEARPIFGMTILRNQLFIVTEKISEIGVYDSVSFNHVTTWQIDQIYSPLDIASCSTNNCLYLCDDCSNNEKFILRVDANSNPHKVKWSIRGDAGHLSVTRDANVVLSFFNGNKINEYSPEGDLIRTVKLSPADSISHPWHAIKTTSMHFIFSHGFGDDPLHRVCVASDDGKIIKSFGGTKGLEQMNCAVHLLEDGARNVLVADMKNRRVLLLSPTLEFKRVLLSADTSKMRFPMRLCLDEDRGLLFVADNNYKEKSCTYDSGRILIFNCKT